ncbi:MAG: geranylgeranyl reductase family protein [Nitrospirae bacterium]|nr:geranylgeranyl reductase family protein [Nitrospirota bacterium]
MANPNKYDVIVVGGGPAGSTAGYLLAKAGLKVLLIDKGAFPRHKLCAGCITDKTIKILGRVFGEPVDALKREGIINFESGRYEIFCRDRPVLKRGSPSPFYFIERFSYDNFLLRKARQKGVEIVEGDGVASVDVSGSAIRTASGKTFTARFIIGADGVNSTVRRSFPKIDKQHWTGNLAIALETFVDRSEVDKQVYCPSLYFDFLRSGYAWIFPNRDRMIIGMCGLNKENRKSIFHSFNEFLAETGYRNAANLKSHAYHLPYGNFLLSPVHKNILLIGDAAGFADPLLGEGIFFSHRSAEIASQIIKQAFEECGNHPDINNYVETHYVHALEFIHNEFSYALKIRNFIFSYMTGFRCYPLKIMMHLLGDKTAETVHGLRSYNWMRKMN